MAFTSKLTATHLLSRTTPIQSPKDKVLPTKSYANPVRHHRSTSRCIPVALAQLVGNWTFLDSLGFGGPIDPQFVSPKLCFTEPFDNTYVAQYNNVPDPSGPDRQRRDLQQSGVAKTVPVGSVARKTWIRFGATIGVALLAGCSGSHQTNRAPQESSAPTASEAPLDSVAAPTTPADYVAEDYDKPGHPALTAGEKSGIRSALARVKPSQRALVRYAFPEAGLPFVIFFQPESGQGAAVFDAPRTYYLIVDRETVSASPTDPYADQVEKYGMPFLIDHQSCAYQR